MGCHTRAGLTLPRPETHHKLLTGQEDHLSEALMYSNIYTGFLIVL